MFLPSWLPLLAPAFASATASIDAPTTLSERPTVLGEHAPIVGGDVSRPGAWPDTAALMEGGFAYCTGTLIAPQVVLTAAHCLTQGGADEVVLGAVDASEGGERIAVDEMFLHPRWRRTFDVGIAILEEPAQTPPRPIATSCVFNEHMEDGDRVTIVGYGVTDDDDDNQRRHEADVSIVDHDCSRTNRWDCIRGISPGGELVAGGDGSDTCEGDSGGPLYYSFDDATYLIGVTSRGASWSGDCGTGGIFVRTDAVLDWIEETAGIDIPAVDCDAGAADEPDPTTDEPSEPDEPGTTDTEEPPAPEPEPPVEPDPTEPPTDPSEPPSGCSCATPLTAPFIALPLVLLVGIRRTGS